MERMSQELPAQQGQLPATPAVPGVTVVTPRALTKQDVAALRARKGVLSDQLNSAVGRRRETRDNLRTATGADKIGLEKRLTTLDDRIARLESDIDENGKQLSSLEALRATIPVEGVNSNPRGRDRIGENMIPIVAIFTIFVLAPIAASISRILWKRGSIRPVVQSSDNTQQLERMEQAIEAIAIEMERVSEGQRFVTRIMSESRSVGEGPRAAQPLSIPVGEKVAAPRY